MRRPPSLLCLEALHHRDSVDCYPIGACPAVLEPLTVGVVPGWRGEGLAHSPVVHPTDNMRSTSTADGSERSHSRLVRVISLAEPGILQSMEMASSPESPTLSTSTKALKSGRGCLRTHVIPLLNLV